MRCTWAAWGLLLLFVRVLTPDAAVLRLHLHQHTTHTQAEPAVELAGSQGPVAKHVFSDKHQHCSVEHLFDAPFQPALPLTLAAPFRLPAYPEYRPQAPVCPASHLLDGACLRGPPVARA